MRLVNIAQTVCAPRGPPSRSDIVISNISIGIRYFMHWHWTRMRINRKSNAQRPRNGVHI